MARTLDLGQVVGPQGPQGPQGPAGSNDWEDITGTPTTLSGYGITDAYTKEEIDSIIGDVEDALAALR